MLTQVELISFIAAETLDLLATAWVFFGNSSLPNIMQTLFCTLISVFLTIVLSNGQYTQEQQGMSVSLFQFDPKELGIYHEPSKYKHQLKLKRSRISKKGKSNKKDALPVALENKGKSGNVSDKSSKLLNANPTPSRVDAEEHLKNVKFDGTHNSSAISILKNGTSIASVDNSTVNTTKVSKEELLFYKNKTKTDDDGSEKVNSVKLTKTTPPDAGPVPIVKVVNATSPKNVSVISSKNNGTKNATLLQEGVKNITLHENNATSLTNESASNLGKPNNLTGSLTGVGMQANSSFNATTNLVNNTRSIITNNTIASQNRTVFDARSRSEILSHFIPTISSSAVDRMDSFQAGSRKHKVHHMYPECYQCPKHSNYTECVKKASLLKCNEGLNNICFAKSHKHSKNRDSVTYEMGCTNHTHCKDARAFPCRDGSKHCFTCCQFNKCNASPHHGNFETDEINLDELTKEKVEAKKSDASLTRVSSAIGVTMVTLSWCLAYMLV